MNSSAIQSWAGQVTTGHGAMGIVGLILACMSGQMSWATSTPLFAAAIVGLLWPENTPAADAAQKLAADAKPLAVDLDAAVRKVLSRQFMKPDAPTPPAANASTSGMMSLRAALALGGLAALIGMTWVFKASPLLPVLLLAWAIAIPTAMVGLMLAARRCRLRHGGIGLFLLLAGCSQPQVQAQLQANGVSAPTAGKISTVISTAVADGTLFCQFSNAVAAVPGVNVKGLKPEKVADACATATIVGGIANAMTPVPVPPPATATAVPVATVPSAKVP